MNDESVVDLQPVLPIPAVWLLHGKGGSPAGAVNKIETAMELNWPGLQYVRPLLPHQDPSIPAEASVDFLLQQAIPENALLVGVSLGGLVAAKLQELGRADLQVMAVSSPAFADGVKLHAKPLRRMAFYSSRDGVINDRVADWPKLAPLQRDFEWLTHDTDQHLKQIVRLVSWYIEGMLPKWVDKILRRFSTRQERDDVVWKNMAEPRNYAEDWNQPFKRPRDFAEIGAAMNEGSEWGIALGDWLHQFVIMKDRRCIEAEPPSWMNRECRALLAGIAEFFARRFELHAPAWVEKPEYFLPQLEYMFSCEMHEVDINDPDYIISAPVSDEALYRKIARTPRELLRRNVVYEARSLTVL